MARSTAGAATLVVAVGISVVLAAQALATAPPTTVREYRARAVAICTAAHAKLDGQMKAQGVEMIKPPNSRFLVPANAAAVRPYYKAARRLMAETLTKLRSVAPPTTARATFNHLYGLMAQFAAGREPPFTPFQFWIHQIEIRERSLRHCTFSLGR